MRPFSSTTVIMSSSACVGCSCAPSPALMTGAPSSSAICFGTPATLVPDHHRVWIHRVERLRGVEDALLLGEARRRGAEVHDVGGEALARDLEAGARARRRLEEQVDDGAAAQRRDLLDLAPADLLHVEGRLEDQLDVLALEVLDREQPASHHAAPPCPAAARTSMPSARRLTAQLDVVRALGRDVLADVVDLDRQLAVAAVDERHHLDRARAAEVHQRVHRRADGAPGAGHVVHQDHDAIVHRGGHLGAAQARAHAARSGGRRGRAWCRARRPSRRRRRSRAGSARSGARAATPPFGIPTR